MSKVAIVCITVLIVAFMGMCVLMAHMDRQRVVIEQTPPTCDRSDFFSDC